MLVDEGTVLYVRSLPAEPKADLTFVQNSFLRMFISPLVLAGPTSGSLREPPSQGGAGSGSPEATKRPEIEVPVEQARCGLMALDIARRMGRSIRVVDVSRELVPRDIVETPDGEPAFFPILVRSDGARLSGESDFTPGRVRRFLSNDR